jgi:hypothetical protein
MMVILYKRKFLLSRKIEPFFMANNMKRIKKYVSVSFEKISSILCMIIMHNCLEKNIPNEIIVETKIESLYNLLFAFNF